MPKRTDGVPSVQSLVLEIIRQAAGPLPFEAILAEVAQRRPIDFANRRKTVRAALGQVESIQATDDDWYAYVPHVLAGASFRLPLTAADIQTGRLRVGPEIVAALWPETRSSGVSSTPVISLPQGQAISLRVRAVSHFTSELLLPEEFGDWVKTLRRDGFDALVLRCQDGDAGRFTLEGALPADPDLVAARNAQVLEIVRRLFLHTKSKWFPAFGLRLLARGAYHGEPQPDPLAVLLFDADGRFLVSRGVDVEFRPDLTPELRRFFAHRFWRERAEVEMAQNALVSPPPRFRESPTPQPKRRKARAEASSQLCYRFRVRLRWNRQVWRIIEMLDCQTLEDLHEAIQQAFNWDNDHLWSFFLSGRDWDSLTQISGRFDFDEVFDSDYDNSPLADEVEVADLGLKLNQQFRYLFDYGDNWYHEVELVAMLPVSERRGFPRIVEQHGEAPPQYPDWDDAE